MNKKTKISIGLALCRRFENVPQILLVRSRTTYSYNEFIFGKYQINDNEKIKNLFNTMSVHEKILILSQDFDNNWYHIWLRIPQQNDTDSFFIFYKKCRSKYYKLIAKDNARRLKMLVQKSESTEPGWEIPKGKQELDETELDCAARELEEETGIRFNNIEILYNRKPLCYNFESHSVNYNLKYYVGWTDEMIEPSFNIINTLQSAEIMDIRWFPLHEIRRIPAQNKFLYKYSRIALKIFKAHIRELRDPAEPEPEPEDCLKE
jgi:8-oxo-dGTP pyrophosphatase MutT (NUDIX family)